MFCYKFCYMFMSLNLIPFCFIIAIFGPIPSYSSGPNTDYCKLQCPPGTSHTVCDRKNRCGVIAPCKVLESTVAFRKHMLDVHNQRRDDVASGKEKGPYNNPGAKNMNALSYDMELEYLASCWNNKCNKIFEHDTCRSSKRWVVGQNMYISTNKNATAEAIPKWFDEIKFITDANWLKNFNDNNFPKDGNQRGHFTQLIWGNVEYIGCSMVLKNEYKKIIQLICNYGPAGNFLDTSVYQFASNPSEIASMCKDGKKNSQFTSLCGDIKPIPTEPMWAGASQLMPMFLLLNITLFSVFCFAAVQR
ncbi:hypothetical protein WA026_022825 [Henosepilachna vigintioctopunctata]|uniref:SCP domain-containing protein n=1 Tax=Henosepilachna vigintioctopunctata TaxID=420089 RepID=A0AAW1V5B1_9CUCU